MQAAIFRVKVLTSLMGGQVTEERAHVAIDTIRQGLPSVLAILLCSGCIYIYDSCKFLDRQQIPSRLFVGKVVLDAFGIDRLLFGRIGGFSVGIYNADAVKGFAFVMYFIVTILFENKIEVTITILI